MCKRCQNIFIGLKKDLFGCFRIEEIRDKDNETGLKEGGEIENVNYSAFHIRDALSLRFKYLPECGRVCLRDRCKYCCVTCVCV